MIHNVLSVISNEVNIFLRNEIGLNEDLVFVSNILNQDGSNAIEGTNKVLCTLVNIEEMNFTASAGSNVALASGGFSSTSKKIDLELTVLFSAHFSGNSYVESLKMISLLLSFFQRKNKFTSSNTPSLSNEVQEIDVEFLSKELSELSNIWNTIGAKYTPSLLYKFKGIVLTGKTSPEVIPEIKSYSIKTN